MARGDERLGHRQGARPDRSFVPEAEGGDKDDVQGDGVQGGRVMCTHIPILFRGNLLGARWAALRVSASHATVS